MRGESLNNIKSWADEDRPREKLKSKGHQALSDAELVAIILGSGSRNQSAVDLAKLMLNENDGINGLAKKDIAFLKKYKGIGDAKAITIAAALELGRRRSATTIDDKPTIRSSRDAYEIIGPLLADLPYEEFWLICCNGRNKVIWKGKISSGGIAGTVVDPKMVFNIALSHLASAILVYHNHPSGQTSPSEADIKLTHKLNEGAALLDMRLLDHIIIGGTNYYSFKDEGVI